MWFVDEPFDPIYYREYITMLLKLAVLTFTVFKVVELKSKLYHFIIYLSLEAVISSAFCLLCPQDAFWMDFIVLEINYWFQTLFYSPVIFAIAAVPALIIRKKHNQIEKKALIAYAVAEVLLIILAVFAHQTFFES